MLSDRTGNFSRDSASPAPENFVTPTIKSDNYTTGRGGAGNMAKNDDPEEARMAQDVGPAYRGTADKQTHIGRGELCFMHPRHVMAFGWYTDPCKQAALQTLPRSTPKRGRRKKPGVPRSRRSSGRNTRDTSKDMLMEEVYTALSRKGRRCSAVNTIDTRRFALLREAAMMTRLMRWNTHLFLIEPAGATPWRDSYPLPQIYPLPDHNEVLALKSVRRMDDWNHAAFARAQRRKRFY